ncbi:UPF0193 protein EVG1 homolog [Anneissia japonica]|uniref:UPF0193 protein EVG1 homolog n=1 Tax=Anneissia japonica TaxID=1529436 RepID=UPI0014257CF3|nr:UPF0193 protein EVG1 homolog [Anneissia japonica]
MASRQKGSVSKEGGIWDSRTPAYSKETQDLLKVMMQESKLTSFQQRQLQNTLKNGSKLPLKCHPTSSAKPRQPVTKSVPASVKVDISGYQGGIRTRDEIEDSGAYERPKYLPGPSRNLDKEKQRLQNFMAYGEDLKITEKRKKEVLKIPEPKPSVDRFDELQEEIQERQNFLEEMEGLGKGKQYRTIIGTEISQKIREMEVIDKKRTQVLKKALEKEKKYLESSSSGSIPGPNFEEPSAEG